MDFRKFFAEFMGVFALCFCGILAIHHSEGLLGVALAHGLAIAVMIGAFAATSGAHFNPAVSLALLITGRMSFSEFMLYVIAQILGGVVACLAVMGIMGGSAIEIIATGTPAVGVDIETFAAFLAEIVGTFLLVTVIYGSAVDKRAPVGAPLYIGLVIAAVILAIGPVSGAALNPARYLGPAGIGGVMNADAWVWIAGPLVGGGLAGLFYEYIILKSLDHDEPVSSS